MNLPKVILRVNSNGKILGILLPFQAESGLIKASKTWLRVQDMEGTIHPA